MKVELYEFQLRITASPFIFLFCSVLNTHICPCSAGINYYALQTFVVIVNMIRYATIANQHCVVMQLLWPMLESCHSNVSNVDLYQRYVFLQV